jgi:alanyl-tRNA synthetase
LEEHLAQAADAKAKAAAAAKAHRAELVAELLKRGGKATDADDVKALESRLGALKTAQLAASADAGKVVVEVKGVKLSLQRLDGADPKSLRGIADKAKAELGSGAVLLSAASSFVFAVTPDLAGKGYDAGRVAKAFAAQNGGSAGGRADFAQGGIATSDWDAAVASFKTIFEQEPK